MILPSLEGREIHDTMAEERYTFIVPIALSLRFLKGGVVEI